MGEIRPQKGFQTDFLSSSADIVIGGGAAGVGKSFSLLLDPLRDVHRPGFAGVALRRTTPQIKNPGGLWDESTKLYTQIRPMPIHQSQGLTWNFHSGAKIKFNHLEHEKNIYDHQGAQYAWIGFDELTHFTAKMFWYLISRNRSVCGIKPRVRCTTNPKYDSFVRELIGWWIDEDGWPIPERCGQLRYFVRDNDTEVWGDSIEEVLGLIPHITDNLEGGIDPHTLVKSLTFVPGSIYENKILLSADPGYLANLQAQDEQERLRLLEGNWNATLDGSMMVGPKPVLAMFTNYPREEGEWFITVDVARFGQDFTVIAIWRGWDVTKLIILTQSATTHTVASIEEQRHLFSIPVHHVIVDQDGVGGGVVDQGGYIPFSSNGTALVDPTIDQKENYQNVKTQLYYRFCELRVGKNRVSIDLDNVWVDGKKDKEVRWKGGVHKVKDLIRADFKTAKKKDMDHDGKKRMIPKEEQKIILSGRSPDFLDGLVMREYFEIQAPVDWSEWEGINKQDWDGMEL